jgi:3',5'-cyclic AMP phosphodiesterase CpdA
MRRSPVPLVGLFSLVLAALGGWAFPPEKPFDPRPRMAAVKARVGDGAFRFAVFGDSKNNTPFWGLLRFVDRQRPDFVLTTGDLVDRGGGSRGEREYDTLAAKGGWFLQKYPTWPVAGNHELSGGSTEGRANFERFFGMSPGRYAFTCGRAKFIALDWPLPATRGAGAAGETQSWLERELAAARDAPKFIFLHNLFYTVGSKAEPLNRPTALTRLLTRYGVTAVFQGHDHGYYRTRRDGVWYITSAGAGAPIYTLNRLDSALPEDVFYGRAPAGQNKAPIGDYWLHVPSRPDRADPAPRTFAVFVTVDGKKVTGRTLAADGEEWDRFTLR